MPKFWTLSAPNGLIQSQRQKNEVEGKKVQKIQNCIFLAKEYVFVGSCSRQAWVQSETKILCLHIVSKWCQAAQLSSLT